MTAHVSRSWEEWVAEVIRLSRDPFNAGYSPSETVAPDEVKLLREALEAIASGEGEPQDIARQTIAQIQGSK